MSGWTKLFSSIVTSSIWLEPDATLRVWIAMLASCDGDGLVDGSVPGFANLARVTPEQMREAIATLCSPDIDSRTPDHDGRRIEAIEGGWRILNYRAYRERAQSKDGSKAPAMRAYRARQRAESGNTLPASVTRYPDAEAESTTPLPPTGGSREGSREPGSTSFDHLHVEPSVAEQAGRFLERYPAIYAKARNGARYLVKPARDHAYACELVAAWPDLDYLAAMLELFLVKQDWRSKNEPGTVGQFKHMAPQCDALLKQHRWTAEHTS